MTFLWILLGILYIACWIYFGMATFRKGHYCALLGRFHLPDPVDHRRAHSAHTRRLRESLDV